MNKIKLLSLSAIALSVFGVATPSLITTVDACVISQVSKNETRSKELTPSEAEQFSKYFELSEDGSIKFAATPATAGAVAIISASIGATVKFAIDKGMNATNVGVNIPFVAKTIIVRTP